MTLPEPGGLGRLGGQASGDLVERGGNGHDDLAFGEVPIPPLGMLGVQERALEVLQVAARAFEGRELLFRAIGPPGQRALFRIDMRVGQPGLGGGHQTIGHERAMVARELPDDPRAPRRRSRAEGTTPPEFLAVRNVQRGRQRRLLAELVGRQDLRDFDDPGLTGLEIGDRHRAVACAEVDTETETSVHLGLVVRAP